MGNHLRQLSLVLIMMLISVPICSAQSNALMEKFGRQPPRTTNVDSPSKSRPPETELSTLGKKLLFFRSLNNRTKVTQVESAKNGVPTEQQKHDQEDLLPLPEEANPLVHVAPPHEVAEGVATRNFVVSAKLPFPVSDANGSGIAVAVADAANQQESSRQVKIKPAEAKSFQQTLSPQQFEDIDHAVPLVDAVKVTAPLALQANSLAQPTQDQSVTKDSPLPQLSDWAEQATDEQHDRTLAMVSNAHSVSQSAQLEWATPSTVGKPVLDEELGVFGEMDGQRSIGPGTTQIPEPAPGQITLAALQPAAGPQPGTALLASTNGSAQASKTNGPAQTPNPNGLVLLPAALRQQPAVPENIKVLPIDRQATSSKPLSTAKVYSTEAMVGPLQNAASFLTQLDVQNDFRAQAAVPVSMVRTSADASGFEPEWMQQSYAWVAPTFPHKPLYFEQTNLERYGRGPKRCVQPLYSGAHFFGSILLMPYKVITQHPEERVYPLGNNRPGDRVPYQKRTLLGQSYPFEALRYFEPYSDYK